MEIGVENPLTRKREWLMTKYLRAQHFRGTQLSGFSQYFRQGRELELAPNKKSPLRKVRNYWRIEWLC